MAEGEHEHARHKHHDNVIVGPTAVEAAVRAVEVRPPEIIVRQFALRVPWW
jgi:hypothetical protein